MNDLLDNIDKIHTTKLGMERIKNNLKVDTAVIEYCKKIIKDERCSIYKNGKNYYCEFDNTIITINAYSYTIITAHIRKGMMNNER